MKQLWLVRGGVNGDKESDAIEKGKIFIGWPQVGDISKFGDRDEISEHLKKCYSDYSQKKIVHLATQLNAFVNRFNQSDLVIMPRKFTNVVAIGKVTGDYSFDPADEFFPHSRSVEWLKDSCPRSVFKQDLLYSLGAFMTVCQIKRNFALERVEEVLKSGKDPGPSGFYPPENDPDPDEPDPEVDIQEIANQQIISLVKSEFSGHALAELVAEILQIEGYTTKVSPPGPDRGVDILAAGGTLGLGEDSICVQVKSGDGPANTDVVLKLSGSIAHNQAQTGLLVSIGGVTAPAQKELDNSFFKLRLWQMQDLLNALFRNYDKLSDKTRAKLPLKQIWIPVSEEGA